jgi:hypothetical protein
VNGTWRTDGETCYFDISEGAGRDIDEERDYKLSKETATMKAEQTSMATVRFAAVAMCFLFKLRESDDSRVVEARKVCSPIVRAILSHHRLCSLLYDRDLRGVDAHVAILRRLQAEFDELFNKYIVTNNSHRVKAHMLLCEHVFVRQLELYGSLSHSNAKMAEMGHKAVTDEIKGGRTNDKVIPPTVMKRISSVHAFECISSSSGAIDLVKPPSEYAYSKLVDTEKKDSFQL